MHCQPQLVDAGFLKHINSTIPPMAFLQFLSGPLQQFLPVVYLGAMKSRSVQLLGPRWGPR